MRTWKAVKEWNVHRGEKSRIDAIGRGGRAAGRLRACGGGDSGGRDSGGGRTCSARTSCRQSSPTLKMQACTASRLAAPLPSPSAAWSSLSTLKATRMGTCAPAPPPTRPPPEPPLQAQGRDLPWVEGRRSHLGGGLHGGGGGGQQRHHPGGGVGGQKQVVPRRPHAPQHLSRRRLAPRFVHLPSNAIAPQLRPWRPCALAWSSNAARQFLLKARCHRKSPVRFDEGIFEVSSVGDSDWGVTVAVQRWAMQGAQG